MAGKQAPPIKWYDRRLAALGLGLVALGLAYYFLLAAFDTARNLDYLALVVLMIFAANRLTRAIRGR